MHTEKDFVLYALISMISIIANEMINLIYIRKYVDFHFAFVGLKRHIKPMLLLFSGLLAVSIYTSLDTIMLGIICGEQDVGYYTVAVKTKSILLTLINSISTVLLPRMSYFLENNKQKEYEKILTMSIELIMLISLPITIFFVVNSSETIFLLGGMNYEPSIFCMQIIMPILLISSFSNIIGNQMLIPNGRDCYFTKAVLSGAVVDIILNALFMPRWGYIGAAVATLFAELTQALFQFHYAKDIFTSRLRKYELIKIIFCVIPATLCVCVTSIENKIASILINAIIFVVVYIVFLHLVNQKTYNKIEKNILKGLL